MSGIFVADLRYPYPLVAILQANRIGDSLTGFKTIGDPVKPTFFVENRNLRS